MPRFSRSPRSLAAGRLARPLLVATLCAAFVTTSPASAQARTEVDVDAVGDVANFADESLVPAPERTIGDISGSTLTHSATRVGVRVDFVDLQKVGFLGLEVTTITNEGVRRHVSLHAYRGVWAGETYMFGSRRVIRCAIRHSVDYEANVVRLSFPRRCASDPRWVKFRVGAVTGESDDNLYGDDALRDRALNEQDRNWALSNRVYRDAES